MADSYTTATSSRVDWYALCSLDHLDNGRPAASLQPPFRWREFTRRVRCLLRASPIHQA